MRATPTLTLLAVGLGSLFNLASGFAVLPFSLNSAIDKRQYNQCEMVRNTASHITPEHRALTTVILRLGDRQDDLHLLLCEGDGESLGGVLLGVVLPRQAQHRQVLRPVRVQLPQA